MTHTPHAEYTSRLEARRATAEEARASDDRIVRARLLLFVAAAVFVWFFRARLHPAILVGAPLAGFAGLLVVHARTRRALARAERSVAYYERALDRLGGRFAGLGETGAEWLDESHPYAGHLDILGEGSLYELLCGARTASGRRTLANWLLHPADPDEILARQIAVRDLRDRIDLREDLAVLEDEIVEALGADDLTTWATGPSPLPAGNAVRFGALSLATLTVAGAVATIWLGSPPLVWMLLVDAVFWFPLRKRVHAVIDAVEGPAPALRQIRRALERIEREEFGTGRLSEIDAALGSNDPPASLAIANLLKRVDALEARENMMFTVVSFALLWGTNFSFAIERWRTRHGSDVEGWIRAVGELEALLDLSTLAYEHPEYTFPTVTPGETRLHGEALAHPLLLECLANDVSLGNPADRDEGEVTPDILVVTGSNMSGKSTLLRTVGVNVVLAQTGAPVRASRLDMSPAAIGASIRTLDSLLDGASRFYAEIHAVKRAVDQANSSLPGLFLLDELLHGTNSEDRRIGADAIVRAFLEREAIGIITTHDLALAAIADDLGSRAKNAHFEFALDGDEIRFDYTLHPGTVKAGNALAIMRAAGLDV